MLARILSCLLVVLIQLPAQVIHTYVGEHPREMPSFTSVDGIKSVAVDQNGGVFVAGAMSNWDEVLRIDPSGKIRTIASGYSRSVAADRAGNAYFILDAVYRWEPATGLVTTVAPKVLFCAPKWLAVDGIGHLYIADGYGQWNQDSWNGWCNDRVWRLDISTGAIEQLFTVSQQDDISGLAVDENGTALFYSSNNCGRIEGLCYDPTAYVSRYDVASGSTTKLTSSVILPNNVALDALGHVLVADTAWRRVFSIDPASGSMTTLIGNGDASFNGDGLVGTQTAVVPIGVAADAAGNVFFGDGSVRVRKLDARTGTVSTLAGNGLPVPTFPPLGKLVFPAYQDPPRHIVADSKGAVYFNSGDSGVYRVLSDGDFEHGINSDKAMIIDSSDNLLISTGCAVIRFAASDWAQRTPENTSAIAGNCLKPGFHGDGGPATEAGLSASGLALDRTGNLYIADNANFRVRRVDAATGVINTVAGDGTTTVVDGVAATATGMTPISVAIDQSGNLFILDSSANRVRMVNAVTGIIGPYAGNGQQGFSEDGGLAVDAPLLAPTSITWDPAGNILIVESGIPNGPGSHRVRKVDKSSLIITTIAGNGTSGYSGDGGPATAASLAFPSEVAYDELGTLYIADTGNIVVRRVGSDYARARLSTMTVDFNDVPVGTTEWAVAGLTNIGTLGIMINDVSVSGTPEISALSNCISQMFSPGTTCAIQILLRPTSEGIKTATVSISDTTPENPNLILVTGVAVAPDFTLSMADGSSSSASVVAGQTAHYTLNILPQGLKGVVALTCSGAPPKGACFVSPGKVSLNGSSPESVDVTVTTKGDSAVGAAMNTGTLKRKPRISWLTVYGFLLVGAIFMPHSRKRKLSLAASLLLVWALAACGGGSSPASTGGTPAGTYSITVTGSYGALSHAAGLKLIVH